MENRLLTIEEVCTILRIKPDRAYQLAREGVIPVVRIGRQIRIDAEGLKRFIAAGGQMLPGGVR